ncbi:protein SAR DEFICIENT 1-like [Carex rostrata]
MAAKRRYDEDPDQPGDKRMKRLPSFSTVIREAIMVKSVENLFLAMEPLLRRVVQEEIQRGLSNSPRYIDRSPRMQIEAPTPSLYRLIFKCPPNLPIYTSTKIEDIEGKPLQILLVAGPNGSPMSLPSPIKIELVVLDGDFPSDGTDDWTSEEFKKYVVKERAGKRPLLTGDVSNITMRDGEVSIGELQFTDNSSWIRSRNFRIAVRVVEGSYEGPRIREAMTDKFVVRDHRGELYRKRYPPSLHDEVWRLEKIGKDGAFHRKLHENRIDNVQDFLQLFHVDPNQLRGILGPGMSDKMWEITVNHAKTCCAGEKIYSHSGPNATVFLNSICEILSITIDGMNYYSLQELPRNHKNYVLQLVKEAYEQRGNLRETDGVPNESLALIQSETVIQSPAGTVPWYPTNQEDFQIGGGFDEDGASTSFQVAYTGSFHFGPYH